MKQAFFESAVMVGRLWCPAGAQCALQPEICYAAIKDERTSKPDRINPTVPTNRSAQLHAVRKARRRPVLDLLHQVADVVDALGLQAVRRTHGELQVVDRTQQQRIETALLRLVGGALA